MFTQRQRKILAILKQHKNNITSDEIARLVGVSSRTIQNISTISGNKLSMSV